jgi:hypothetical protein
MPPPLNVTRFITEPSYNFILLPTQATILFITGRPSGGGPARSEDKPLLHNLTRATPRLTSNLELCSVVSSGRSLS